MTYFEDGLGNPIAVGNRFIYTLSNGSSSPTFGRGVVVDLDPVIQAPEDSTKLKYASQKKTQYGDYAVQTPYPARDKIDHRWSYRIRFWSVGSDWHTEQDPKMRTLHRVDQVVVVEALI